jgi:hypothetical protein
MKLRLALLTDLRQPVLPTVRSPAAALAFDLAEGLAETAADTRELAVDLFARRGSWHGLPLVSVEPGRLGLRGARQAGAAQEALYVQLILQGMLRGYDLVHCLAPVVAPLQLLTAQGIPVVQTLTVPATHPAALLPGRLIEPRLLARTAPLPLEGAVEIPPGVDVTRFRPAASPAEDFLLWLGSGRRSEAEAAARAAGLPLRIGTGAEIDGLLPHAHALLHLERSPASAGPLWPLRALACGTPVAGWAGAGLERLLDPPELGALAPAGDDLGLAAALRALPDRREVTAARRERVLGLYGRRAMVARYRELYRSLATQPSPVPAPAA